ncbi:MAG: hypothetical protein ACI8ZF_000892 [Candidatus Midichloriaceae bacterium]|jgi:hypothetical protein
MSSEGGMTTGGSIGGGMGMDTTLLKDLNVSFENLQESKNLGSTIKNTPFSALAKLAEGMKGLHDTLNLSSLTPLTQISPPTTPIGAGTKIAGLMSRKG